MKTILEGTWGEVSREAAALDASSRVRLEIVTEAAPLAADASIQERLDRFDRLAKWIGENVPKHLPQLSDHALSRESIYSDRGL